MLLPAVSSELLECSFYNVHLKMRWNAGGHHNLHTFLKLAYAIVLFVQKDIERRTYKLKRAVDSYTAMMSPCFEAML